MSRRAPDWLAQLQQDFSAMLRAPLQRSRGRARARLESYPDSLCREIAAPPRGELRERLAVYNRQYWFRLISALQNDHPLTARLLGAWAFNELAIQHLERCPPRGHDLAEVSRAFALDELDALQRPHPAEMIRQALAIDRAHRLAFEAPAEAPLSRSEINADRLARGRLVRARNVQLVHADWAFSSPPSAPLTDEPGPAPARRPARAHLLIARTAEGEVAITLEAGEARLIELLSTRTVSDALAQLELELRSSVPDLDERVRAWMGASMSRGLWTALTEDP